MDDHLTKPVDPEALRDVLKKWLPREKWSERPGASQDAVTESVDESTSDVLDLDLPGSDVPGALRRLSGDQNLYVRLLEEFSRDFAPLGPDLSGRAQAGDWPAVYRLAHQVKGVAANLGLDDLARASADLEKETKTGPASSSRLTIWRARLDQAVSAIGRLERHKSAPRPGPVPTAMDMSRLDGGLHTLSHRLLAAGLDADDALNEIRPLLAAAGLDDEAVSLENAMARFDYDAARPIVQAILDRLTPSNKEKG
jgi:HPt (histidine-containing phosphotransfer) domain-containing protein